MALNIVASYNNSYHSPGADITLSGLTGYNTVTVERIEVDSQPDTAVRGADQLTISADTLAISDYEAPIGDAYRYWLTAEARTVVDNFDRTTSPGFGTTSSGVPWDSPTPARFSVNGTVGVISLEALSTVRLSTIHVPVTSVQPKDAEITAKFKVPVTITGSSVDVAFIGRYQDSQNYYYATMSFSPTANAVTVQLNALVANSVVNLTSQVDTGLNPSPSLFYRLKFRIAGNTLQAKVWLDGNAEPNTWTVSATNTSFASGTFGVRGFLSATNTNTLPLSVQMDDLLITALGSDPFISETAITSTSVTIPSPGPGAAWLKSVFQPALSSRVNVVDFDDVQRPGRVLGEYEVLGKPNKVVITDGLGGREGTIRFATFKDSGNWASDCPPKQLEQLLIEGGTLLLQTNGYLETAEADMYLQVVDVSRRRIGVVGNDLVHLSEVKFIEVDRPDSSSEGLGLRSWNDVLSEGSWDWVNTSYTDWLDLLQRSEL